MASRVSVCAVAGPPECLRLANTEAAPLARLAGIDPPHAPVCVPVSPAAQFG